MIIIKRNFKINANRTKYFMLQHSMVYELTELTTSCSYVQSWQGNWIGDEKSVAGFLIHFGVHLGTVET